jgi:hypothetical protein
VYLAIVVALMLVLPAASVTGEALSSQVPFSLALVGKWFVIWSVGARLVLAGLRQIIQPRYTAQVILSLKSEESLVLVRELGFANLAIGLVGVVSAFSASWRPAASLAGSVFYGLAGANHALRPHRSKHENIAMVSDLWVAVVLLASLVALLRHPT